MRPILVFTLIVVDTMQAEWYGRAKYDNRSGGLFLLDWRRRRYQLSNTVRWFPDNYVGPRSHPSSPFCDAKRLGDNSHDIMFIPQCHGIMIRTNQPQEHSF